MKQTTKNKQSLVFRTNVFKPSTHLIKISLYNVKNVAGKRDHHYHSCKAFYIVAVGGFQILVCETQFNTFFQFYENASLISVYKGNIKSVRGAAKSSQVHLCFQKGN